MNAAASSTSSAVPSPIAKGNRPAEATVAAPRAAVTIPMPTNKPVPTPIAVAIRSPLFSTGSHAIPISSKPLPIAQISTRNSPVATPSSAKIAVPRAMFTIRLVPIEPSPAVARPTAARIPAPIPIAVATVPPFAITGSHAIPTCSNAMPIKAIAPTMSNAAAATSPITTSPSPRFFAKEVSFGDNPVLIVVSSWEVVSVTVSKACFAA